MGTATSTDELVACRDCDLLHRRAPLEKGETARCRGCGAILYRRGKDVVSRTLAFAVASATLLIVANAFPFMEFEIGGRAQVNHMVTGVEALYDQGFQGLAVVVLITTLLAPAAMIVGLLFLLVPLGRNRIPRYLPSLCRVIEHIQPWAMLEVYLLGVIVSVIKLSQMAEIVLGPACYAFCALIVTLTAALGTFDSRVVWERLEA